MRLVRFQTLYKPCAYGGESTGTPVTARKLLLAATCQTAGRVSTAASIINVLSRLCRRIAKLFSERQWVAVVWVVSAVLASVTPSNDVHSGIGNVNRKRDDFDGFR